MTWAQRYIAWTCNEKVTSWEWSSTICASWECFATQQVCMSHVTVVDAEMSEDSFFASWLPHRTDCVNVGTNSLKFVCRVVFPVTAPQPSDTNTENCSTVATTALEWNYTTRTDSPPLLTNCWIPPWPWLSQKAPHHMTLNRMGQFLYIHVSLQGQFWDCTLTVFLAQSQSFRSIDIRRSIFRSRGASLERWSALSICLPYLRCKWVLSRTLSTSTILSKDDDLRQGQCLIFWHKKRWTQNISC